MRAREFGLAVLDKIGIPSKRVTSVRINIETDDLPSVTIVRHLSAEEIGSIFVGNESCEPGKVEDK